MYLIGRSELTGYVDLVGGVRRQWQDASTTDINKSAANGAVGTQQNYSANAFEISMNYRYTDIDRVYVRFDRSFRFANIDEFWGFDSAMNRVFAGALLPQSNDTFEMGGSWRHGPMTVATSIFQSLSHNEIRYDPAIFANNNSPDDIRRTGLRWYLTCRHSANLSLSMSGRLQESVYASGPYNGNGVALVPNATTAVRLEYSPTEKTMMGFVTSYVSGQHYDASPAVSQSREKLPAYWFSDLFSNYRQGPWELKMTIRNVFGQTYATYGGYGFVSMPAASGNNSFYYFPSDPRALLATVRYNF
jgi:iron complex outermembrane receptor protein